MSTRVDNQIDAQLRGLITTLATAVSSLSVVVSALDSAALRNTLRVTNRRLSLNNACNVDGEVVFRSAGLPVTPPAAADEVLINKKTNQGVTDGVIVPAFRVKEVAFMRNILVNGASDCSLLFQNDGPAVDGGAYWSYPLFGDLVISGTPVIGNIMILEFVYPNFIADLQDVNFGGGPNPTDLLMFDGSNWTNNQTEYIHNGQVAPHLNSGNTYVQTDTGDLLVQSTNNHLTLVGNGGLQLNSMTNDITLVTNGNTRLDITNAGQITSQVGYTPIANEDLVPLGYLNTGFVVNGTNPGAVNISTVSNITLTGLDIAAGGGYVPVNPLSLVTKEYSDGLNTSKRSGVTATNVNKTVATGVAGIGVDVIFNFRDTFLQPPPFELWAGGAPNGALQLAIPLTQRVMLTFNFQITTTSLVNDLVRISYYIDGVFMDYYWQATGFVHPTVPTSIVLPPQGISMGAANELTIYLANMTSANDIVVTRSAFGGWSMGFA